MNKTALKTFATNARKELLKKVEARAMKIGVTRDAIKQADIESSDAIFIDGKQLSQLEKDQRNHLINRIEEIGFDQVMEEVAYTWFNRFTALRYMEVNNYLPTKIRVLSSNDPNQAEPDMMKEALNLNLELDKELVYEYKLNNKSDDLFKYLIIAHCNDLNRYLPFMFEKIDHYTQILFPDGLLATDSFVRQMTDIEVIPEDNWEQIEVIGWLYQYYISDEKDRVIKAKKKYKTEEIPFATQLFTPDWIVRYMVQNSLGRYWIESHPEHRDLLESWEFYLENPNPEPDFEEKLAPYINKELRVEDIKCFDPAMGSGHILVYMFDVLYEIYSKCGYMDREIPRLIIENNLYGLDIDDRAYQLACFSVVMKALEYNKRFFRSLEREGILINLSSIQDTNGFSEADIDVLVEDLNEEDSNYIKSIIKKFRDAKLLGSLLLEEEHAIDVVRLEVLYEKMKNKNVNTLFNVESRFKFLELIPGLIKQHKLLTQKYDVVVTNPPYVSSLYMNQYLSKYIKQYYSVSKEDVYACFIYKLTKWLNNKGMAGVLSPYSWMFQSSYKELRKLLLDKITISSLVQLEYNAFEVATVQVASFTIRNYDLDISGEYINLSEFPGIGNQPLKTLEAVKNPKVSYRYTTSKERYQILNDSPIAYWLSNDYLEFINNSSQIKSVFGDAKQGLASADNNRFLRLWFEVDYNNIGFEIPNQELALSTRKKWFPHNKGGKFKKWYGNNYYVINWYNDGEELRNYEKSVIRNPKFYFKEGITWSDLTAGGFSARYSEQGKIFDSAGPTLFPYNNNEIYYGLAYLNSAIFQELLNINCAGMHYSNGVVGGLPFITCRDEKIKQKISVVAKRCVDIVKSDWDESEISWDFKKHPYISLKENNNCKISEINSRYIELQEKRIMELTDAEKSLNDYFQNISGIEVFSEKYNYNQTIQIKDTKLNVTTFLQYIVGCMFGRFSLDYDGIVYAGGEMELDKYKTFMTDQDNILPIVSESYYEDDIVSRIEDFLKITFGEDYIVENLSFIAENIGMKLKETPKETIRRYFLRDFYEDHKNIYSTRGRKAPIYWLITSGKEKAFNCFIYIHRYDKTTLSRIRTDYLHDYQIRLDAEKKGLLSIIDGNSTAKEISNAKKELKSLDKKIEELKEFDEKLHHMADMQIEIDLDDGVLVNHEKFNGLVAKI